VVEVLQNQTQELIHLEMLGVFMAAVRVVDIQLQLLVLLVR
jgi:hypothetical protein